MFGVSRQSQMSCGLHHKNSRERSIQTGQDSSKHVPKNPLLDGRACILSANFTSTSQLLASNKTLPPLVSTLHPPNCWLQQNKIPNRFPWEQKLAATWCRWRQHFLKHPNCIPLQTLHFTGPGAWARGVSNDTNFIFVLKI